MKTITKIEAKPLPVLPKRKRVAAYARVSVETEETLRSFSAQVSYYNSLIQQNPNWEYAGVYADRGISGTSTKDRKEFQRLLADCDAGKVDIILVKSISRLARNVVDLLTTVRHLKDIGVEVRFEREKINSLSMDGEFLLGLLATFAQEEARSISENIKWKVRKGYAEGHLTAGPHRLLGYEWDGNNYAIVPEEAKSVRRIFELYLSGLSLKKMAIQLEKEGVRSCKGNVIHWDNIYDIVKNEIYAGDRLLQKYFVEDSLTHKKIENKGQLPKYYHKDTHPAIIDRDTWEAAQKETARRKYEFSRPRHPFSRLIKCGICGKSYHHKAGKLSRAKWGCLDKEKAAGSCKNYNVMEWELLKACNNVLGLEKFNEAVFKARVRNIIVRPEGILEFHFHDGDVQKEKFTTDKVELRRQVAPTALYQGIEICCGIHGHRLWHTLINGRHYWKCGLKVQHKADCDCWSHITGKKVLQMVGKLTGRDDIAYENLAEVVEKSIVLPDNTIEFHFKDGRIEKCPKP